MEKSQLSSDVVTSKRKSRSSNIELLRIIAMFMIIACHTAHGGIDKVSIDTVANTAFSHAFRSFGQVGVALFIIISGYFGCKNRFRTLSMVKMIAQVCFYILTTFIFVSIFHNSFPNAVGLATVYNFLNNFTFVTNNYWFVMAYILFYGFSPFISRMVSNITKKQFLFLLTIMFSAMSVVPLLNGKIISSAEITEVFGFWLFMYLIGCYIRLYPQDFSHRWIAFGIFTACFIIYLLSLVMPIKNGLPKPWFIQLRNNPILIIMSTCLFTTFKNINMKEVKVINVIAGSTFGVYLLHESYFMRFAIWKDIFHIAEHINDKNYWLYAIMATAIVFAVGIVVDLIRKYFLESPLFKVISNKGKPLFDKIDAFMPQTQFTEQEDKECRSFWLHIMAIIVCLTVTRQLRYTNVEFFVRCNTLTFYLLIFMFEAIFFAITHMIKLKSKKKLLSTEGNDHAGVTISKMAEEK